MVGEAGRSTEEEVAEAEVEAEVEVREKMEEVEEDCQVAAAGYRKRMEEEVEHHMRRAIIVLVWTMRIDGENMEMNLTGAPYGVDP